MEGRWDMKGGGNDVGLGVEEGGWSEGEGWKVEGTMGEVWWRGRASPVVRSMFRLRCGYYAGLGEGSSLHIFVSVLKRL